MAFGKGTVGKAHDGAGGAEGGRRLIGKVNF